jgi:GMP synthase (glutamine-hydrolysing)
MLPEAAGDPVLGALGKNPDVFHFHYDSFTMPEGTKLYGTTGNINQVFKVGPKAWGMQFHIEVGLAAMHSWFATYPRAFEKLGVSVEGQKEITLKNWREYRKRSIAVGEAFAQEVLKYNRVTK